MMRNAHLPKLLVVFMASIAFAGCLDDNADTDSAVLPLAIPVPVDLDELLNVSLDLGVLVDVTFTESVVDFAADRTGDLYEPTIEVCDDGSIYITGHTIAVDTTGAPVFASHDGGETWEQAPWFQDQDFNGQMIQGSTPPVSDEIFLACGDDGWLYGTDITLASYPVNAWSGYGNEHAYWNFNAYDETKVVEQAECDETKFEFMGEETSVYAPPAPAKDRPWSAYAGGKLLLTSNPAGGPNQIGILDVSSGFSTMYSLGHVPDGIDWNLCAGPGGSIPGVPDIRADGLFAAPQRAGQTLYVTLGNADDVMDIQMVEAFNYTSIGEITSVYGHTVFDAEGDLFVGISNNTRKEVCTNGVSVTGASTTSCSMVPDKGGFIVSSSTDGGETFTQTNFTTDKPLRHFYMDANEQGPGALVVWAVEGDEVGYDWFIGHVGMDANGTPILERIALAIEEGPAPSAHVTGAAVGPDGRAYLAMYTNRAGSVQAPTHPLSVYIQESGPTLTTSLSLDLSVGTQA
jgi:hypothetical protein